MKAKNIQFDVALDGLVYKCTAIPKTEVPVTLFVLNIETTDCVYRVDMALDERTNSYTMLGYSTDTPEITELEFKISDMLCSSYIHTTKPPCIAARRSQL